MSLSRARYLSPLVVMLSFVLFMLVPSGSCAGAWVDIGPTSILPGDTISIVIGLDSVANAYMLLAGPVDSDLNILNGFHVQYFETTLDAGVFSLTYPEGTLFYEDYEIQDVWIDVEGYPDTDSPGLYLVIVALADGDFDIVEILGYIVQEDMVGLLDYFIGQFQTWTQLTTVRILVIPESMIGTAVGVITPMLAFIGLRRYKGHRTR